MDSICLACSRKNKEIADENYYNGELGGSGRKKGSGNIF
jgi:hypothetical protein